MSSQPAQTRPSNLPRLTTAQRSILALLRHDYLAAFEQLRGLMTANAWQTRDLAITGLADLLDLRLLEQNKPPTLVYIVGWQPLRPPSPVKTALPKERLLTLLETYPYPSQRQPRNLNEWKHLQCFGQAKQLIERALTNDPHKLVRSTALVLLYDLFSESRKTLILPALERAHRRESDPDLQLALEQLLKA
jgi:hypothetical protein